MTTSEVSARRWTARPVRAALIRAFVFVAPIGASIAYVFVASRLVPKPADLPLFVAWWIALSATATLVVMAIDRLTRRLLPLAALFKLSLLFPDRAPSRFRVAMQTGTVATMEERLADLQRGQPGETPAEAAQRLLRLVAALDAHDRVTRGHSERVRAYTRMIGEELKLPKRELDLLNWAALLHDVGKLKIPYEILNKPGKPTEDEWRTLRLHPVYGAEFVEPLREWLGEWATAVTQHHERWDGKGYPSGLAGEQISFPGRIVAVADVFDVITSARSYKTAGGAAEARAEIARCAGTQFDPRVVRALLNVSLGRLRFAMGPLSWLANAPILGRLPLTPAATTLAGSAAAVVAAAATGLLPGGSPAAAASEQPTVRPRPVATHHALRPPSRVPRHRHAQAAPVVHHRLRHRAPPVAPVADRPPAAAADTAETPEDTPVTVQVLANDSDPDGGPLRVVDATEPGSGSVHVTGGSVEYVPAPNYDGPATFAYAVSDGTSVRWAPVHVDVLPVNDPPTAVPDQASIPENWVAVIDPVANDTDPEADHLGLLSVGNVTRGAATVADGRIRYEPPPDFVGSAEFSYTVGDGNGGTDEATVAITVTPVNSAPSFAAGGDQSVGEDSGPQVVPWASRITPGASWDAGQTVGFTVRADDTALFATGGEPRVGTDGKLSFTPARDANGLARVTVQAHDDGGRANGGVDTTDPLTFAIVVTPVNDPPTFAGGGDVTASANAGPQTLSSWVRAVSPGPADEAGQSVSFIVSASNSAIFTASGRPAIAPDGTLRFTPAPGTRGTSAVTVKAVDTGGTADGGEDTSAPQQSTITVTGVNGPPSFVGGPAQTAFENSGAHAIPNWATGVSPGPPDDAGQHVDFLVSTTNAALFAAGGAPAVAPNGTLTYRTAPDANGTATVTVRAHDDGGTADGGSDTSPPQTFTISINAVNSQPSFTAGADDAVAEDSGARAVAGWATGVTSGPPDESGQIVTFTVTTTNAALFTAGGQPAISTNGTLSYTPAPNANGSASVTVRAVDDGGTANGGVDTSAPAAFAITVTPVNDPPVANADTPTTLEDSTGVTFDVLANDTDVDGGALTVVSYDASGLDGSLTQGSGGTFTYVPSGSYNGTDSFTYTVGDGAGGTATATVTITVVAQPDPPAAGGDSYTTAQDTPLVEPAPGVLLNDADEDGDPLTVETTPVAAPANGTVAISADGSFTYTPNAGFVGTDTFIYRVDDGTGLTGDGTVTISVLASPAVPSLLHLQTTGPSSDFWDMSIPLQPAASGVPDFDGDGKPGLTIKKSDGEETVSQPQKWHGWVYPVAAPLVLNGPVTLQLWSSVAGFALLKDVHPYLYLYDCAAGGTGCVLIASNNQQVNSWNGLLSSWVYHDLTIGSVTRTIPAGRELRVKLLVDKHEVWVALTAAYPSALSLTLG